MILFLLSSHVNAQETPSIKPTSESFSTEETVKTTIQPERSKDMIRPNVYGYKVTDIDGKVFDFATLKGKKILIVNTASLCGNTPQYEELEKLHNKFKNENLVIIAFPANDFGKQEPGDDADIKQFCTKNYQISFPIMSKVSVKGETMCELYKFLTQKSKNGVLDSQVEWNFQKYLINEYGELVAMFPPKITPLSDKLMNSLR